MSKNKQVILIARPTPGPLEPSKLFEVKEVDIPKAETAGQIVMKVHYLSLDPTMRGWMTYDSYLPAVPIGSVMRGGTVGEVIESKSETLKVGDIVSGSVGWQQYALVTDKEVHKVTLPEGVTPADQVSMQLTGLTAMVGIYKIGAAKFAPGTTVLVSGAAGSTGSFAGQIYKNALGCRVVGTAGGAEKCKYAKEVLGFDDCIDYKDAKFEENLKAACKDGIMEYYDNVGGRTLELALDLLKQGGRVVLCGGISQYDSGSPKGPGNYMNLVIKRCRMEGFIFFDYAASFPEMYKQMFEMKASGKLKIENDIRKGLENAGEALKELFEGKNKGKMMVQVA